MSLSRWGGALRGCSAYKMNKLFFVICSIILHLLGVKSTEAVTVAVARARARAVAVALALARAVARARERAVALVVAVVVAVTPVVAVVVMTSAVATAAVAPAVARLASLGSLRLACVGFRPRLQPRAKMGGGSKARFARLALRLARGKVGKGAAALASLASLGLRLSAFAGCWW